MYADYVNDEGLIADIFTAKNRGTPMGIFTLSIVSINAGQCHRHALDF
jgi:hypothetical protein